MYLDFEKNGDLILDNVEALGPLYKFFDRLRGKGIAYGKLVYHSGLTRFDALHSLNQDTPQINIEPTQKGLILRLNKSNRLAAWGIPFSQLEAILLYNNGSDMDSSIVCFKAEEAVVKLLIPANQVRAFTNYLHSAPFKHLKAKISINLA